MIFIISDFINLKSHISLTFAGKFFSMFNRYWREYPWFLQLFLFVIMIFTLGGFFIKIVIPYTVPLFTGVKNFDPATLSASSTIMYVRTGLAWQGLFHMSIFLLPSLLFAYQTHPRPAHFLGLRKPGKNIQWLLVALVMLSAIPIMLQMQVFMSRLNLGREIQNMQAESEAQTAAFLNMPSPFDFLFTFFVMAILPAFGEELLFRGILLRFASKKTKISFYVPTGNDTVFADFHKEQMLKQKNMIFPIVLVGVMFALMHANIYGLPSILTAGILLGVIYYWTSSLWCSILAHLIFNGLQIAVLYFGRNNAELKHIAESNSIPMGLFIGSIIVFSVSFYLLWKNRTSLTPQMMADYSVEELDNKEPQ